MRKLVFLGILLLGSIPLLFSFPGWEKTQQPASVNAPISIVPDTVTPHHFFIASPHAVFRGNPISGWSLIWNVSRSKTTIKKLHVSREQPNQIFVLTNSGLYQIDAIKKTVREIFEGQNTFEQSILSFAIDSKNPSVWLLGTEGGLFESKDSGKHWELAEALPANPISLIFFYKRDLYIASNSTLYRSDRQFDLEPILTVYGTGAFDEAADDRPVSKDEIISKVSPSIITSSAFSELGPSLIWIGTRKGVYESQDFGHSWSLISQSGMRTSEIVDLDYSDQTRSLFAATPLGIYQQSSDRSDWKELFQGLVDGNTADLLIENTSNGEKLLAATGEGLMELAVPLIKNPATEIPILEVDKSRLFHRLIRLEPTPHEIHQAVIKYDNLSNKKINRWHVESRLRSLFPSFSFGKDFSRGNNIDLDRGSTKDADLYIIGPDEIDEGWDVDVSWDLGDLIWSSSQTSIDSREKLMVELRHEHLAQATRIYFERRRLQMEIILVPSPTIHEHLQRLIRMDELSSLLDGMTGGFFNNRLHQIYEEQPSLMDLWAYPLASRSSLS